MAAGGKIVAPVVKAITGAADEAVEAGVKQAAPGSVTVTRIGGVDLVPEGTAGTFEAPLAEGLPPGSFVEELFQEADRTAGITPYATALAGGAAAAVALTPDTGEADDLSPAYLQRNRDRAGMAAVERMLLKYGAAPAAGAAGTAATPAQGAAPAKQPAQAPQMPQDEQGGSVLGTIARNVIDIPGAALAGARDAVKETLDLIDSADRWLAENAVNLPGAGHAAETLPDVPEGLRPQTVTGEIVKSISQFITGFVGAGKGLAKLGLRATGRAARTAEAAGKGAIADFTVFDPQEEKLADLWQDLGLPQNALTDFLASEPGDTEAEGRFSAALEGLALGAAAEGLTLVAKTLRSARRAQAVQRVDEATGQRVTDMRADPKISERDFDLLGSSETRDLFGLAERAAAEVPLEEGAKGLTRAQHEPEFFINWRRIEQPEDVQNVMGQMADAFRGDIEQARRGTQTFGQIKLDAQQEDAWKALMQRREGQPLNASQAVAARTLWASSAEKLTEVARAAAQNPSEANLFAFRKMLAVHHAVQTEVIAARTETARALASWRIPVGSDAMRAREIESIMQANGGPELAREMAARVAALADKGEWKALNEVAEKGVYAKSRDAFMEVWINALLSGPKTHIVNMMSNTSVMFMQMAERAVAARISSAMGSQAGVQMGEAAAQWFGMVEAFKDMARYAAKMGRGVSTPFDNPAVALQGKVETRPGAISSEALGLAQTGWLGRAVDGLGTMVRLPGSALEAEDVIFKTFGYRMELHAQALRLASQEIEQKIIPPAALKQRIADIVANPPESVKMAAVDQALYQTFTQAPGRFANGLMRLKNTHPGLGFILPFVRTPANILHFAFERTPLALPAGRIREAIKKGGAERDLALARVMTGTATLLMAADLAFSGVVSGNGPKDSAQRQALQRTGWQPYSIKVGDRWYSYSRLDPVGMMLGLSADMVEILANTDFDRRDTKPYEEVFAAMAIAIASNAMNKTYLTGISDLMEAMSDPERYGHSYFQGLAQTLVPTGVAEVRRVIDPYMREARSMLDALRNRTPGMSDSLPVSRDLWGRERYYKSGLGTAYDVFSPIYSRSEKAEPIDQEIIRQGWVVSMPSRVVEFDGVPVDLDRYPEVWSRYLALAGNELKLPQYLNKGALDFLNDVVQNKGPFAQVYRIYSDGPGGGKEGYVKEVISTYRAEARRRLLQEFPALKAEVDLKKARQPGKIAPPRMVGAQ